jgi:predicted Zn-dependent protease with MMP-like domain
VEAFVVALLALGAVALVVMPAAVVAIWRERRLELAEYVENDDGDDDTTEQPLVDGAAAFELLVQDALDMLPPDLRERMSNVEIVVEDEPPAGAPLLGLYEGVPLTRRSGWYGGVAPDRITIYRGPLERRSLGDPERLAREVGRTVLHEVAHHFGISDERLVELDRY